MDLTPVVSVVMSTYNDADELSATIDSVLSQTFTDFEFIIVNDGSSDPGTQRILADYAAGDSRIKIISKGNQGITRALIDGCNFAQGVYIARIDVGDVMTSNRLQLQKEVLDQYPKVGFVSCWTEFCAPEWEHLWISKGAPDTAEPVQFLTENLEKGLGGDIPHHGSVMFRKSVYDHAGGYRRQFYYGQDWDLWYRLGQVSNYYLIHEVLYKVRVLPKGISMKSIAQQNKIAKLSRSALVARFQGIDETELLKKAAEIRPVIGNGKNSLEPGYYFIGENLRQHDKVTSRKYFIAAIKESLFSIRSWIRLIQTFI